MANIIINVGAKQYINFSPVSVQMIRAESNTVTATLSYTNGTGQLLSTGQVLYTVGTIGQPGYYKVSVSTGVTVTGSGSIPISIDAYPSSSIIDGSLTFQYDTSMVTLNIDYNSRPQSQDLPISMENRQVRPFTVAEFVSQYTDFDTDTYSEIKIDGNTTGYQIDLAGNGTFVPYVSGSWIPILNVANLRYTGQDQNTAYQKINSFKVKDDKGNESI